MLTLNTARREVLCECLVLHVPVLQHRLLSIYNGTLNKHEEMNCLHYESQLKL